MHDKVRTSSLDIAPTLKWRWVATLRRTLLVCIVLGQTIVACYYLLAVLPYHGGTWLEIGLAGLFAVLYAWIAVGFWMAVFGFVLRLAGGDRYSLLKRHPPSTLATTPLGKTAVVMPIYHEPVHRTLIGLKSVYQDIERSGNIEHFEFYILSDSRDPDVWLAEQAMWSELCDELGAQGRLFYRRRSINLNYKSGNVADFLRRWGRRVKYMIVLDADSLLGGDTLVRMIQLMEREPSIGILQTNPQLINGQSLFARVQQFANRLYSPLFATGLAAIQMGDAVFWGHNAILRVGPFMKHCGLRKLRGFGLFRGAIMSHDFVEAAYMARAGYEVWLEPGLSQSYEESPPTLADELTRDARWSKGNLQHLAIMLFAPRLRFAHRMAFLNGIMSYLASPLWLGFLILTTIEAARMALLPIDYFPEGHRGLFPLWPEWRPEWAIGLALSTLALLFLPKFLAILDAIIHRRARRFGGGGRMLLSVLIEILVSVLLAPVRMMAHSRYVLGALLNVSLSWAGQNRTEETTWRDAMFAHAPGFFIAVSWSAFAWSLDSLFFYWSLPVAIPLILAAPTSVLLSRVSIGSGLRRARLMLSPEETVPPRVLVRAEEERQRQEIGLPLSAFERAVLDPRLNTLHQAFARQHRLNLRAVALSNYVDRCIREGPDSMTKKQLSHLCLDRESLAELHRLAWRARSDNYWGRRIDRLINWASTET